MRRMALAMLAVVLLVGLALAGEDEAKAKHKLVNRQVKQARQAIAENPADAGAHRQLVRGYYLWKRMREITTEYQNKLKDNPDNAVYTYALGLCHSYAGDKAKAEELYKQALRLDAKLGYPYYSLGCLAHQKNELDTARDYYLKALEADEGIAQAHHNLGSIYLEQKDYSKALEHLERAERLAPGDAQTLYNLGLGYLRTNQTDQAIATFARLELLAPDEVAASTMLAEAYKLKSMEVPEYLRRSAAKHNEIGAKLLGRKNYQGAEQEFRRSMEIDPGYPRPYNNLAWLYATAEDTSFQKAALAVRLARMAVRLTDEKNWHCLDTLAESHHAAGQLELAVESENKALNLRTGKRYLEKRLARFQEETAALGEK